MKLKIKKNSYGLRVYCTKCKKQYNYHNDMCNHYDHQHYKSLVSYNGVRKTKMFKTKDFDEALTSAIQFKKDVKNGVFVNAPKSKIDKDEISILDAANIFIEFKNGINVPEHLKKDLSNDHLSNLQSTIQQLINILRANKVKVENLNIKDLNDYHVGYWYKYMKENYAVASIQSKLKLINSFVNYVIDEIGVLIRNPFKKVHLKMPELNTTAITKNEFEEVLKAIDSKSPYQQLGGKRQEVKNRYRSYLKNGLKLELYTGLRREELVTLTWNDIYYSKKSDCLMIMIDNLKVERITGKQFKKKFIPVGPDLLSLLYELGYEDFKDSNLFILEPNRKIKYKTMMTALSKGFSHYYRQAFPDREPKKFKILRKTYLSYLNKVVGNDMIELSSHSSMRILNKHYVDPEIVAKGLTMKIFE